MPGEEVWAETTDGGLLRQLFGHYPTLHDASIRMISIDRKADMIAMTVDYRDSVGVDDRQTLAVSIRLEWRGVESMDLPIDETNVFGLDFERDGAKVVTNLEVYPGVFGKIVSETVEAVLVQVDSARTDDRPWIRMR